MDSLKATKRTALSIIMMVLCLFALNSADIRWNWYGEFPGVKAFRYQLNGNNPNGWTVVDASCRTIVTTGAPDGSYSTLYLEETEDGEEWHETFTMRYLPDSFEDDETEDPVYEDEEAPAPEPAADAGSGFRWGFRGVVSPYSMGMTDFYNGHDIKGARYFSMIKYGMKADIETFFDIGKYFSFNIDTGYRLAIKKDTVVPGGEDMHFVKFALGIDGILPAGDDVRFYGSLTGGAVICFNAGMWSVLPVIGAGIGMEIDLTDNFSFGFETGAEVSYGYDSDPLYRSISTYPDILSVTVSYRF